MLFLPVKAVVEVDLPQVHCVLAGRYSSSEEGLSSDAVSKDLLSAVRSQPVPKHNGEICNHIE